MNTPAQQYLQACEAILDRIRRQQDLLAQAADWFSQAILAGRVVHLFGAGHSRMMVEEMWPRYGSFPGFNPLVELSLTFHNPVVGSNGQRQAMFLETVSGLAERIVRNFEIRPPDAALVISSSGCNTVPIEVAELLRERGCRVVGMVSLQHCRASSSKHPQGKKLIDVVDLVLDTGAPAGDATVQIEGLVTPVAPGSSVGGCMLVNAVKAEVAERLVRAGAPPTVLTAACIAGARQSAQLFEDAYDQHAHRLARLLDQVGHPPPHPAPPHQSHLPDAGA